MIMLKNLLDLALERTRQQAFVFYLVYTLLCIACAAAVAAILIGVGLADHDTQHAIYKTSKLTAQILTPFYCVILTGLILQKKERLTVKSFLFVVLAGLLGLISGLLGMIIPAWLTTKPAPKTRWF
jgi:uncharacterized membrane protein